MGQEGVRNGGLGFGWDSGQVLNCSSTTYLLDNVDLPVESFKPQFPHLEDGRKEYFGRIK